MCRVIDKPLEESRFYFHPKNLLSMCSTFTLCPLQAVWVRLLNNNWTEYLCCSPTIVLGYKIVRVLSTL